MNPIPILSVALILFGITIGVIGYFYEQKLAKKEGAIVKYFWHDWFKPKTKYITVTEFKRLIHDLEKVKLEIKRLRR